MGNDFEASIYMYNVFIYTFIKNNNAYKYEHMWQGDYFIVEHYFFQKLLTFLNNACSAIKW